MAEASPGESSLSLTIDKSLLECSICCGPFDDPRSLPCLHPFCCGCLENWAKTCSKDKKTLTCPLCKKVYRIPAEEGIKGFPAHFLVADLQSSVEKANQKSFMCEEHGEKKIYYCETCGCATCSDCIALDPTHQGHTFIRLKQAAEQQRRSLENLVRKVQDAEQKCKAAIEKAKQVKQDLNKVTKENIKALDGARDEYINQVNKLVKVYRQEVYHKRKVQIEMIKHEEDILCSDLTAIRNSCELATNVTECSSDIGIISLYPSLSSTLEQHAQHRVSEIDSTLSQFLIQPPKCTTTDLASLEQLLCDKLHVQVPRSSKVQAKNQTDHLSPKPVEAAENPSPSSEPLASSASSSSSQTEATYSDGNTTTAESREDIPPSSSWFRWFSWFWSAPSVKPKISTRWKLCKQIYTTEKGAPWNIAAHPNGDIAVTTVHESEGVAVFSGNGQFKFSFKGPYSNIKCIAVTPDNHYIIPARDGENKLNVYTHDSQGTLINTGHTHFMLAEHSPVSIAVDSRGSTILGYIRLEPGYLYNSRLNTISVVWSGVGSGESPIFQFKTPFRPISITCTPDDRLILAFGENCRDLQVMDQSGHNASIIEPPPGVQPWHPSRVCCSKQGELFVFDGNHPSVFRYAYEDGEFKCQDRSMLVSYPLAFAVSATGEELFVVS